MVVWDRRNYIHVEEVRFMSNGKKPAKAGDESYAVLQSLIAKGRKEGMLRASELNAELEKLDISPEKIEEIYEKI